jgi:hypothetical protein
LARAGGTQVELVRHNELEKAVEVITRLSKIKRTVWFACDGVFSMYGDLAPVELLHRLLSIAPNVRLYVDDAHGMSWTGFHGRGSFLSRFPMSDRLVLATSLNKAFSAGGGCLVFPSVNERESVRLCGAPFVFSGPLQPPMLGAALASADLHLSEEITGYQKVLKERVDLCNRLLRSHHLPLLAENESPIFFLGLGLPRVAFEVASRLKAEGFYTNVSMYPTVPMKRAGIRLALTAAHTEEDVQMVVEALAHHVPAVLAQENLTAGDVERLFAKAIPEESRGTPRPQPLSHGDTRTSLVVDVTPTIQDVNKTLWDSLFGTVGACSWDALKLQEDVFSASGKKEHQWKFHYLFVRQEGGPLLAATHFTTALVKDDMLSKESVSRAVENKRTSDPYYLTSKATLMGSQLSEGNHLWVDRKGPWKAALRRLVEEAAKIQEAQGSEVILLRDLPGEDPEMDSLLLDSGFVKVPMLDSFTLSLGPGGVEALLGTLGKRARTHVRALLHDAPKFQRKVYPTGEIMSPDMSEHLYHLYKNVASRKLRLNVFHLPENLIPSLHLSPAWEVVTLSLNPGTGGPEHEKPVAWYAAHRHGSTYSPFFCGLDYGYLQSHSIYRQMLLQIVTRAVELGATEVHLGMDAEMEKSRFGAVPKKTCVYVQAQDHFNGELLRELAAEVQFEAPDEKR